MKIFNNSNQKGLKIPELTEDDMPVIKPAQKMKAGGSPMKIMNRAEVLDMWAKRQTTLEDLLKGL